MSRCGRNPCAGHPVIVQEDWIARLRAAGVPDAAGDFRRIFRWAYGVGTTDPEPQTRDAPNALALRMLDLGVAERETRRPVSQIIGKREFWKGTFKVTHDVLDPRPETELLVELGIRDPFDRVLDLGTGSGCIVVSLLMERPNALGVGTDISEEALRVAGENAESMGVAERVNLRVSDWYDDVGGRFDLIVSNPPYIAEDEFGDLPPEVRNHEPRAALAGGADGLSAFRAIVSGARNYLTPGGRLLVEIGSTQADGVRDLLAKAGLESVAVHDDLDGRDRVVAARNPA
ncbi:MAG: peptide chain release factor N(5)-glutamine methyltransferase [Boseongicola sp. SB0673_bin_14]|nr:peptide chain release factor N(5)-glutamine methyltransferase [Boseongicola sp. SB0667_bin_21]MYI68628.1 peptide chain release factor N(5)-glutamine methyltransferase [Boseongicola sp. SB0673_bin_14]